MTATRVESNPTPRLPPRWVIRAIWLGHRALYAVTGGRFGLRAERADRWGMMRLTTIGRRSGRERTAILGFVEDGPNLVTVAMNGWADPEPAWWLNLQAKPEATVDLPGGGSRRVYGREADRDERPRLWAKLTGLGTAAYTDASAALRSRETPVVILEPRAEPSR
jgi:F420H(2)-dependent quinone reductase